MIYKETISNITYYTYFNLLLLLIYLKNYSITNQNYQRIRKIFTTKQLLGVIRKFGGNDDSRSR